MRRADGSRPSPRSPRPGWSPPWSIPATGLCATESRFSEAHVVERVAALPAGRLEVAEVLSLTERFLASDHVVRLVPDADRRRPPEWFTVEHRAVEDAVLADLHALAARPAQPLDPAHVEAALTAALTAAPTALGPDQAAAVRAAGRPVVVAPTHKAVAEVRSAGVEAHTVARLRLQLSEATLAPGSVLVVDEVSSSPPATRRSSWPPWPPPRARPCGA